MIEHMYEHKCQLFMKPIEPIKLHEMKIMVQPISLQNQKHITESEALPQCPENAKPYKIKNLNISRDIRTT